MTRLTGHDLAAAGWWSAAGLGAGLALLGAVWAVVVLNGRQR